MSFILSQAQYLNSTKFVKLFSGFLEKKLMSQHVRRYLISVSSSFIYLQKIITKGYFGHRLRWFNSIKGIYSPSAPSLPI
jgi:hypothetical protein